MVQVTLAFVPPGGGEIDYSLDFELPGVPQVGDYISVLQDDPDKPGTSDFIVRRTWWHLDIPKSGASERPKPGKPSGIVVECEFARGAYSSEAHKRSCETYDKRGQLHGKHPPVKEFDVSCY